MSTPLLGDPSTNQDEDKPMFDANFVRLAPGIVANVSSKQALAVQAGLLTLLITVYVCVLSQPIILFTGHPLFNIAGFVLLGQALVLTQPEPESPTHKTVTGQVHGIFAGTGSILFLVGAWFIYTNKADHGADHITTWHATFGLITYLSLTLTTLVGVAQLYFATTVFGSVGAAKAFYKYHRRAGYANVVLIATTVLLALESDFNKASLHIPYVIVVPALALILGGLYVGLKVSRLGF